MLISMVFDTAMIETAEKISVTGRSGAPAWTTSSSGAGRLGEHVERHGHRRGEGDQQVDHAGQDQAGDHRGRERAARVRRSPRPG